MNRLACSQIGLVSLVAGCCLGCSSSTGDGDLLGTARVAITQAPSDARCFVLTVSGARSVTRMYDLTPGQSSVFALTGLPLGADTFTGQATAASCNQVTATSTPAWISDPVVANIVAGVEANVALVMHRNGQAKVAVDFQDDDAGAAGGTDAGRINGTIFFQPHTLDVSIDSIDPPTPLEGRPALVFFSASNHTSSTVVGRVIASVAPTSPNLSAFQTSSWSVSSLAAGASMRGVLTFTAPGAAAANGIQLFFDDASQQHLANAAGNFDTGARYAAAITNVHVDNPRSTSTDTDYLILAGGVGPNLAFDKSAFLGNGGAGHDFAGISAAEPLDTVPDVGPPVTIAAIALNQGFDHPPSTETLNNLGLGYWNGTITDVNIHDSQWWMQVPLITLFDCDGLVAAERRQWTSRDLLNATPYAPTSNDPTVLGRFTETRYYHGLNSPVLCGETSNYHMTWQITRVGVTYDRLVTVSPVVKAVVPSQSVTFTAASDAAVLWSVDGGASNGTIDSSGRYVAPSTLPANDYVTIRATANDGSGRSGRAFVTRGSLSAIAISPCFLSASCN